MTDKVALFQRFSHAEYQRRHKALRKLMERDGIDVLLCYGDSTSDLQSEANVAYLSNCYDIYYEFLIFPRAGEPHLLISNPLYLPNAKEMAILDQIEGLPRGKDPFETIVPLVGEFLGNGKIGIVHSPALKSPFPYLERLQSKFGTSIVVDCTRMMSELMSTKSSEEVEWFKKGAALTEYTIDALFSRLKIGMNESQAVGILAEASSSREGRLSVGFLGFTPSQNPEIIFPRQFQSSRILNRGDLILTELSVGYHGYYGQVQRPAMMNTSPPKEYAELYDESSSVYHHLVDLIRDDLDCDIARTYLNKKLSEKGLQAFDVVVHGWGLQGVTEPLVDPTDRGLSMIKRPQKKLRFKEGMLLVIQPNLVKGKRGIQVGNLVQVGKRRCHSLQKDIGFNMLG